MKYNVCDCRRAFQRRLTSDKVAKNRSALTCHPTSGNLSPTNWVSIAVLAAFRHPPLCGLSPLSDRCEHSAEGMGRRHGGSRDPRPGLLGFMLRCFYMLHVTYLFFVGPGDAPQPVVSPFRGASSCSCCCLLQTARSMKHSQNVETGIGLCEGTRQSGKRHTYFCTFHVLQPESFFCI